MTRIVGTGGYVTVGGSTIANVTDWQLNPAPEFGERRGWSDTSVDVILIHTGYTGRFTVERNNANSAQEAISTTAGVVTLVLNNEEDSYSLSVLAWQVPGYRQGDKVSMVYQFRDNG